MNDLATVFSMPALLAWLLLPVSLLLLAGFTGWQSSTRTTGLCWRLASRLLVLSIRATALIGVLLVVDAWIADTGLPEMGHRLGLQPDGLAVWMALMVGFIGWVILRYADTYLLGDPARHRFLPWFLTTLASVLLLVFTNNLLVLAGAWIGVSLALHHLLTLYHDRPEARLAAFQKFIVSRIGDICVMTGVWLLYRHYGTFDLPAMITSAGDTAQGSTHLEIASVLFAVAALLKCAQVPFHGWLLRVMEAPTPVSALLHAGVINLGGFLWLRLFPVLDGFSPGHLVLLAVGGLTAVVGVLTMMSQASVKHALAWSTSAQMGFMLFEIGMGAYTLAFLHLLAHSLYKAHSFLASGRTVSASRVAPFATADLRSRLAWSAAVAGFGLALLWLNPGLVENNPVLGAMLILAIFGSVLGLPAGIRLRQKLLLGGLAVGLIPIYGLAHWLLGPVVAPHFTGPLPLAGVVIGLLMVGTLALVSLILLLNPQSRIARTLRFHVSNGFYLMLPFDHLTTRLANSLAWRQPAEAASKNDLSILGDKS
ncbi:NADH-quinone oxidoreductase subunit L [Marinobacter sp. R17]|uniref:NADH-quinone oxidoreductase subunit L n=1 Tax=Marinobacter sp. R17 TaxID=2484250 RepID=UPI000F4B7BA4|nr:NADH-quinone oxidoreductase subunit L [Marinobacter sp. R17]ROU00713.1 NADH-quinone oxidoreductase subunit L [Marinobacter sp. R17]